MAVDKETLIKHKFWIIFGVYIALVLIAVCWLPTVVADFTATKAAEIDVKKKELDRLISAPPKNESDFKQMDARRELLDKRKDEIWKLAWDLQKDVMTWPEELKTIGELNFGDKIDSRLCTEYSSPGAKIYDKEVKELANAFKQVRKVAETRDGKSVKDKEFDPIVYRDGSAKVLNYVHPSPWPTNTPSSEEVWLAQEDYWVQTHLLLAMKQANEFVARFEKVQGPADLAKGELFREHFENPQWHLDLIAARGADQKYLLRGKIKNRTSMRLPIFKLFFLVQTDNQNTDPTVLAVEGESLGAGKEAKIDDFVIPSGTRPDGLLAVTQLYENRNSPVRRIDEIKLGYQSHRTFDSKPMAKAMAEDSDKKADAAPPAKGAPPTSGPGAPPDRSVTKNGLLRDRYMDVTTQVRRLPLVMVVQVDQDHIPEVLSALANSKLRLQITQVGWQHARPDPLGVPAGSPPAAPAKAAEGEEGTSMVELSVYGIASLYERYQPKPTGAPVAATPPVKPPVSPVPAEPK